MTDDREDRLSPDIKFHLVRKIECHKVIGLAGPELLPHESKYLEFHKLSGVILFERNIQSSPQVRELVEQVNERLSVDDHGTPLIMVDHEGDFVAELKELIGVPPSAMAIGATGDPAFAREVAYETGVAMQKLGVNVVLAPVADCYFDPACSVTGLRTFGKDPDRVAEFVCETIRGYSDAGVVTCVKHFPGHGSTGEDSHVTLPKVDKSLDDLRASDLVPFDNAIRAGADMVMMSHVAFSLASADAGVIPASFDSRLIDGVLRKELGFEGPIITDALEMEGARAHVKERYGGLTGGFERSILAGCDLLLYSQPVPERIVTQKDGEPMIAVEVMQTIIDTLERIVDRERIDKKLEEAAEENEGIRNLLQILNVSEARIARLRERAGERQPPPKPKAGGNVISLQDYAVTPGVYKTAAERSIILARDPLPFVPVGKSRECVVVGIEYAPSESIKRQDLSGFVDALCRNFPSWESIPTIVDFEKDEEGGFQPTFEAPTGMVMDAARFDPRADDGFETYQVPANAVLLPVFSTRGMPPPEFMEGLESFVVGTGAPFVIVTGWPIFGWVPGSVGVLLTLGASAQVAAAASAVLKGECEPQGSLRDIL